MTESSRELFNQVLTEINNSVVSHEKKDQMKELVFHVMKFNNGSSTDVTDIKDTLTLLTVFIIRHSLRAEGSGKDGDTPEIMNTRVGRFIYLIRPIAWPLAFVISVVSFSPHCAEILNAIKAIAQ